MGVIHATEKPHNMPIKLSVRSVTHLACASCAPARPAAYRRRYADSVRTYSDSFSFGQLGLGDLIPFADVDV